jgi:hypothetical protein
MAVSGPGTAGGGNGEHTINDRVSAENHDQRRQKMSERAQAKMPTAMAMTPVRPWPTSF